MRHRYPGYVWVSWQVVFENEPGEGSGVLRSLFTAFSEAVLSEDGLPQLEGLVRPRKGSCKCSPLPLPPPHLLLYHPLTSFSLPSQ